MSNMISNEPSEYTRVSDALKECRCVNCGGLGECNDAELGDIGFRRWKCPACDGSGFNLSAMRRESMFFRYTLFALEKSR